MFSLRRYLIENKYVYLFLLFCAIVGFFCGIFLASGIYEYQVPAEFQLTFWSCAAKFLIPLLITALCGLFFAGMIGIIGSVGWAAGNVGFLIAEQFCISVKNGLAFLFSYGIPVGLLIILGILGCAATAVECNLFRFTLRRKGLARPMSAKEKQDYFGKMLIFAGVFVILIIAERMLFYKFYQVLI